MAATSSAASDVGGTRIRGSGSANEVQRYARSRYVQAGRHPHGGRRQAGGEGWRSLAAGRRGRRLRLGHSARVDQGRAPNAANLRPRVLRPHRRPRRRESRATRIGELVGVAPLIPCRVCDQCATGNFSRCRDYDYFGSRRRRRLRRVRRGPGRQSCSRRPRDADPRAIAMTDPASIALHAVWKAPPTMGQRGRRRRLRADRLVRYPVDEAHGLHEVVAIDVAAEKLAQAREAERRIRSLATTPPTGRSAVRPRRSRRPACRPRSNLATFAGGPGRSRGLHRHPGRRDIPLENRTFQHLLRQEVSLHGAWNSFSAPFPGKEWTVTLAALVDGTLKWEFMIIARTCRLKHLPRMFETIRGRNEHLLEGDVQALIGRPASVDDGAAARS